MTLSRVIRARRKELELTLAAIGDAVGVTESAVSLWEREGEPAIPDFGRLAGLADVLQLGSGGEEYLTRLAVEAHRRRSADKAAAGDAA